MTTITSNASFALSSVIKNSDVKNSESTIGSDMDNKAQPVLRTIIVDDEPYARQGMRMHLEKYDNIEIIAECQNAREAIRVINLNEPDLMFLDIEMPGINGFGLFDALQTDTIPLTVFVTAYDHYAVKAFKVNAIDYILKPAEPERIEEAIRRSLERFQSRQQEKEIERLVKTIADYKGKLSTGDFEKEGGQEEGEVYLSRIAIKTPGRDTLLIACRDIDWVDAAGDYMCVHVGGDTHILRRSMRDLEKRLDPALFQRVHRSTIINLTRIKKVIPHANNECFLVLDGDVRVKVSRSYKEKIQRYIETVS